MCTRVFQNSYLTFLWIYTEYFINKLSFKLFFIGKILCYTLYKCKFNRYDSFTMKYTYMSCYRFLNACVTIGIIVVIKELRLLHAF